MRSTPTFGRRLMLVSLAAIVTSASPSYAQGTTDEPVDGGAIAVVDSDDTTRGLTTGTGSTVFTLQPPDGASCPGDSAHDQWRVQSFIVPVGDDPAALTYELIAPAGDGRYALYQQNTDPYTQVLTIANETAGQPGQVAPVPALSFAVFPPGTLPPGRYRMGLACTYFRETAVFWDTEVDVIADPSDEPARLGWTVVGASVIDSTGSGSNTAAAPGLVALGAFVALVAVAGLLVAVRTRRRKAPSKEYA